MWTENYSILAETWKYWLNRNSKFLLSLVGLPSSVQTTAIEQKYSNWTLKMLQPFLLISILNQVDVQMTWKGNILTKLPRDGVNTMVLFYLYKYVDLEKKSLFDSIFIELI